MPSIHPTAIVDPKATIADDATVGPQCIISGPVTLHAGVNLIAQCHITGPVTIGARTRVYPFAAIGFEPQDYKFGPDSVTAGVTIGEDCLIREYASVHAASNDHTPTRIGDRVFMMTSSHVGHDGNIGNDVVMVSGALCGGHVTVGDKALLGGGCLVHQHCRVGTLAMMGGGVPISADLPPFMTANAGNRIGSPNLVGMKRNGFDKHDINTVKQIVSELIRRTLPKSELMAKLDTLAETSNAAKTIRDFIAEGSRPICAGMTKQGRGL
ncbi:MAG: acyl-ACP--UDP-N-acetylglucosamine O-acyltransferase [Planctomycetota bacterium]